jgi:Holliday junction resolvasome RuvABC endonuclease subunit
VLAMTCASRNIPLFGVNTGSMKKLSVGHGRASKGETVEAMHNRYPSLHIPSHDVADAMLVGLWVMAQQADD